MGMFDDAMAMLSDTLMVNVGVSVVYRYNQPGFPADTLIAVSGLNTVSSTAPDPNTRLEYGERDYIIKVSSLRFGVPIPGDRITELINGGITIFEALSTHNADGTKSCFQYTDQLRTLYRIHTKRA